MEQSGTQRSVVHAPKGMVAAAHPLAATIGVDVLQKGGTAVDAAIAVNAALGFLEPAMCGVGGDLFAMVWDGQGKKLHGLNASGPGPSDLTIEMVPEERDGTIPLRSPYTWTIPGCVDGWFCLHERFGRLPMVELLAPAIAAARQGEPVPRVIASHWADQVDELRDKPGFAATYLPNGQAPREGEVFRNEALATTYQGIAEGGRDVFYSGRIAREIQSFSTENDGYLTLEDLSAFRAEWVAPISTTYRGVTVFELPPNSQGLAVLQMLNILETFDLRSLGRDSAELWHLMVEAKKLAFEDRARYYADPSFTAVPVEGLLSKDYARQRAGLIDRDRAALSQEAGQPWPEKGDTTLLIVGDAEGNMVSLIQSLFSEFGSGYALQGFALQNRGAMFSLNPDHPNALKPGKRPFHTIIPAFAMRDGEPWLAFGVMGGAMQPQGHAQVLINLLDFDFDLQQAGDAARFRHSESSEPTGWVMTDGGVLLLEPAVPESIRQALAAKGHRIQFGGSFGGYQAIARDPITGCYSGASELRKDGCAMGY